MRPGQGPPGPCPGRQAAWRGAAARTYLSAQVGSSPGPAYTAAMRHDTRAPLWSALARACRRVLPAIALTSLLGAPVDAGQAPRPSADDAGDPTWTRRLQLADGRTFVSDGAMAVDAAIAKPSGIEAMQAVPGAVIDRYLQAPFATEVRATALTPNGGRYVTPNGTLLGSRYVDFLRRKVAQRNLRFRLNGDRDPVVVVLDGRPIAVLMPMAK